MTSITDTLTQQKQELGSTYRELLIYVCGVTPYAESHIGHAMSYIIFDVLRRFLEFRGYRVRHVQNFTDIDDKLIERAKGILMSRRNLSESEAFRLLQRQSQDRRMAMAKLAESIVQADELLESPQQPQGPQR